MPVYVNVTVLNEGNFQESTNLTVFYNVTAGEAVGSQSIRIPAGENRTLCFLWDTKDVPYDSARAWISGNRNHQKAAGVRYLTSDW